MSPLHDAIRPLLNVAPTGLHLFDRERTGEVLVIRNKMVWLSLFPIDTMQRREEYRVLEWGPEHLNDLREVRYFSSRWELLTWLTALFSELEASRVLA